MNRMFNTAKYLVVVVMLTLNATSQASLIGDTLCFGMTGQSSPLPPLPPGSSCQNDETEIIAIELV